MKKVQQAGDHGIYQKRSGRYAVQDKAKKWVNGDEKTKILLETGLIKVSAPKPAAPPEEPEEAAAEEAPGEEEGGEQPAA